MNKKMYQLKPCPNCGGVGRLTYKVKRGGGSRRYYVECVFGCWTATKKYPDPEEAVEEWNKLEKEKPETLNSDRLRNLTDRDLSDALYELQQRDDLQQPADYLDWLLGTDWGLDVDA